MSNPSSMEINDETYFLNFRNSRINVVNINRKFTNITTFEMKPYCTNIKFRYRLEYKTFI